MIAKGITDAQNVSQSGQRAGTGIRDNPGVVLMKRGDFQLQAYDKRSKRMKYVRRTSSKQEVNQFLQSAKSKQSKQSQQSTQSKQFKRTKQSKQRLLKRFNIFLRIYTNEDGSLAVPSDLEASVNAMKCWPLLSVCCPALHFMSLLGKDGPWKSCLSEKWSQAFDLKAETSSSKSLRIRSLQYVEASELTTEDLKVMALIVQSAAMDTWKVDREEWDLNVGRRKLYFMGWQRIVKRYYPIMQDIKDDMKPVTNIEECLEKFRPAHAAGLVLHKAAVPRDLSEYVSVCSGIMDALRKVDPAGVNTRMDRPYTMTWLIRSHMYAEMQCRGITLSVSPETTLRDFSSVFPDARAWTYAYASALLGIRRRAESHRFQVLDMVTKLQYKFGIEMLTCLFCLFGTAAGVCTTYLEAHCEALRAHRIKHTASTQVEMHPEHLLTTYGVAAVSSPAPSMPSMQSDA